MKILITETSFFSVKKKNKILKHPIYKTLDTNIKAPYSRLYSQS